MIKLDEDLLRELGLANLPAEEKKKLLAHIYETLEMRVGMRLAEQMSDAQLSEFEQFIDRNDEAGALHWLETNFPNYKDVVAEEFEKLKHEVRQLAPQILAASAAPADGQGAVAAPAAPPAMPQPPYPQQPPQQYQSPQPPYPPQPPMPPSPQNPPQNPGNPYPPQY